MKKTVIVNIYNFIRKSHEEPSRFIQDDFDTIQKQIQVVRQYGLPATYALKYDALTDGRYQKLLRENTDPQDEISAWWEITRELCEKAGVRFRGKVTEEFDERVNAPTASGTNRKSAGAWWMPTWIPSGKCSAGTLSPSAPGCWIP